MRVDKACWFLQFSNESIKTIADKIGACDRYHFAKIFVKSMGQSPAKFRKSNSGQSRW